MNLPSKEDLRTLIEKPEGWCVSIYMPVHRAFPEMKQDVIRFKNLLREAEQRLTTAGLRSSEAKKLMKPGKPLIDDKFFWQHQADGLATFICSDFSYHYRVPLRFNELVVVTDRFHIKPLLPLISHERRYYILALSQNQVRLLRCTRYSAEEVELGNAPRSLSDALKYDAPEKQLQFHTRTPAAGGERAAMFHGQGLGKDDAKNNILRFFQLLDQHLYALLGTENAPLVLAGVEYLLPIYREANRYRYIAEQSIVGNPEGVRREDLHAHAQGIVAPHFLKAQKDALAGYKQLTGSERVSKGLAEIVPAALEGRIDTLFVAVGVQRWGLVDPDSHRALLRDEPQPGDQDLLDFAAVHTYINGGSVYVLKPEEMPDEMPLAAVFRY